jgi:hypothetical protein
MDGYDPAYALERVDDEWVEVDEDKLLKPDEIPTLSYSGSHWIGRNNFTYSTLGLGLGLVESLEINHLQTVAEQYVAHLAPSQGEQDEPIELVVFLIKAK